jgi:aryl-alcohol dehydrogenase-like predicted oxidoreductase
VERSIENEFATLSTRYGMGIMAWSPLASGLLSGKYRPSRDGQFGEGRLQTMRGSSNPGFAKFSERNFAIVAELEKVTNELDRSMAQVAINWVAHRPGVAVVLISATKPAQIEDNLRALAFTIPEALLARLEKVSMPPATFPYWFFTPGMQAMLAGANALGNKPEGYMPRISIHAQAAGAGAVSDEK